MGFHGLLSKFRYLGKNENFDNKSAKIKAYGNGNKQ